MCLFPTRAELQEFGKPKLDPEGSILLPCGKCTECLQKRAFEWATRAKHEISQHDENCFLTLTYDDEHLPSPYLVQEDFQKFMKRLRKKTKSKIRYMYSGEYGSKTFRPHFHAIIFGYNPPNQRKILTSPSGEPLYSSEEINELWKYGFHSIGTANEKTAYYIASYAVKGKHHTIPDPSSGELIKVSDYMRASKRPAIGKNYFEKNMDNLLAIGDPLPRYYEKLLERLDENKFSEYQNKKQFQIKNRGAHERLAKFTITKDQRKLDGKFRSAPELDHDYEYELHLKQERDLYVQRKEKNESI